MNTIIKRHGKEEPFDERKVYGSCYAACVNCHIEKKNAEKICILVSENIKKWIIDKEKISSEEIFKKVSEVLRMEDSDAAFLYETHRDIS